MKIGNVVLALRSVIVSVPFDQRGKKRKLDESIDQLKGHPRISPNVFPPPVKLISKLALFFSPAYANNDERSRRKQIVGANELLLRRNDSIFERVVS